MDSVAAHPAEGRLLAGLNRNVFPAEAKCADAAVAEATVRDFARDTLAHGVVGGAAYMTVHREATRVALAQLGELWSVGLVLMEMNCPSYLRVDSSAVIEQMRELANEFGHRYIVTDRFAVTVGSDLRRRSVALARELGLRTQTHLNEQLAEKWLVERQLYPNYASYTDVYFRDGLLDERAILAHCIHNTPGELERVAQTQSVVAHCPTSNTLLCSGIMPLDDILAHGIDYAICTDVGASPTTSMLAEMAQYLKVHAGRSSRATPAEALYRATFAPARILGIDDRIGSFDVGKPMSFIEVEPYDHYDSADETIRQGLLGLTSDPAQSPSLQKALDELEAVELDVGRSLELLEKDVRGTARKLENRVISVTLQGFEVFRRGAENVV
jgi:guanine deaminase